VTLAFRCWIWILLRTYLLTYIILVCCINAQGCSVMKNAWCIVSILHLINIVKPKMIIQIQYLSMTCADELHQWFCDLICCLMAVHAVTGSVQFLSPSSDIRWQRKLVELQWIWKLQSGRHLQQKFSAHVKPTHTHVNNAFCQLTHVGFYTDAWYWYSDVQSVGDS